MKALQYSRISNYEIKKILRCFSIDLTATQTQELLGFNRKTVNRYYNTFRDAVFNYQTAQFKQFVGDVEVDETYFGARRLRGFRGILKRGRGTRKQPVFGIFLRNGNVYTEIVPDCKKKTLQGIIRKKIDPASVVYSDSWRGYDGLVDVGYDKHFRVNHGENVFALEGNVNINGIESFWSYTKRRLKKFNGVKVNFNLHLKECEYRWRKDSKMVYNELRNLLKL